MSIDISFVLPCHNEADALPEVLPKLAQSLEQLKLAGFSSEVIVVNDGSDDGSRELLAAAPFIQVKDLPERAGYGAALKYGFEKARGNWVVFFDLDRTYDPADVVRLMSCATETNSDMVLGYRDFKNSGMPWSRTLGNRMFVVACRMMFGSRLKDMCTGFRVLRRDRLQTVLGLKSEGFNFSIQLSLFGLLKGWRLEQIPIRYEERLGSSKLNIIWDGLQFLQVIVHYRWKQLRF